MFACVTIIIKPNQVGEIMDTEWDEKDYISIFWHVEDVFEACEDEGIELTNQQAREVLRLLKENHDCNYGFNWETIIYFAQDVTSKK